MIVNCDCCGFNGVETKQYRYSRRHPVDLTDKKMNLCDLCAGTLTGNAFEYPDQYENADVLKTICYVGNSILKAIKDK